MKSTHVFHVFQRNLKLDEISDILGGFSYETLNTPRQFVFVIAYKLFTFLSFSTRMGRLFCANILLPNPILCLESAGSLASGWSPGETLENSLIGCLVTACIVLPQKS